MGPDPDQTGISPHSLVPLRIPTGWRVVSNDFCELEPVVQDGVLEHAEKFASGMLYMKSGCWDSDPQHFVLDLSWIPENDPEGRYRVTVALNDFDHELKVFESRSRQEVQHKLEEYMSLIAREVSLEDALQALAAAS